MPRAIKTKAKLRTTDDRPAPRSHKHRHTPRTGPAKGGLSHTACMVSVAPPQDGRTMVSVNDIRNRTFQTVRFRTGYDVDEVDDFPDAVMERMKAGQPMSAAELEGHTFRTVRFKEGDDTGEVDEFLEELAINAPATSNGTTDTVTSRDTGVRDDSTSSSNNATLSGDHRFSGNTSFPSDDPFSGGEAQRAW